MARPHTAVHRTILVVDVERFGSPARTDRDRVVVRSGLYRVLNAALATASVALTDCDHQNSGDGVLVVIPPSVPKDVLAEVLPGRLIAELRGHNESHDSPQHIRLRMVLHAGEVRYDDHGVVGTAINHAFRLLDAAVFKTAFARSPGPLGVVASAWFFDEVVRHSADGIAAAYRQIRVTAKETDTTAWLYLPGGPRATVTAIGPSAPRQLPPAGRHFVGREEELHHLGAMLDQHDAATVVITAIAGTAGIGKTTLATRWANSLRDRFPDGQLHVDLRGFDSHAQLDPAQVLHGFLEALGVAASAIPGDLGARSALYRSLLAERRLLVLLDNARSADQVRPLLPNSPTCLVVITSRNRLDSLVVREGAHRIELDLLPFDDAVRVLTRHVAPDHVAAAPDAVADLVGHCARLPLALSIIAARAANRPDLSLRRLADQVRDERDRLDLLDLGERDIDIRAVLSWSYQALSAPAARLFRLLGVHPGPDIDMRACAALIGAGRAGPLLTELTAAHLLEEHQPDRFRFHDLLRVYARECADRDEPELHTAMTRMVDYYVAAATEADCHIQPCREGVIRPLPRPRALPHVTNYRAAMAWFAQENATLLALVEFAAHNGLGDHVGRLAWAFHTFLNRSGQLHERVAVHRAAVDTAADDAARLSALPRLARACARQGQLDEAELLLSQATELVDQVGTDDQAVSVQLGLVLVSELREQYDDALDHAQRVLEIIRARPNPHYQADGLAAVARQRTWLGFAADALPLCEQALVLYRRIGHVEGQAMVLTTLGYTHQQLHQYHRAIECFAQALAINRELGSRYWEAHSLDQIGDLHALLHQPDEALSRWQEAAAMFDQIHQPEGAAVHAKISLGGTESVAEN
jgi:tetratricopeptide (TPR) repeat protein